MDPKSGYQQPSAPDIDEFPPDYFSVSTIPPGSVLVHDEAARYITAEGRNIPFEHSTNGIVSRECVLDHNPESLWQYFANNLDVVPKFHINLHGYHQESRTVSERDSQGRTTTRTENYDVADFYVNYNVSQYVSTRWSRLLSKGTNQDGSDATIRQVLEHYTHSTSPVKEIHLKKVVVGWDEKYLTAAIDRLIRNCCHYRHSLNITYVPSLNIVAAKCKTLTGSRIKKARFLSWILFGLMAVATIIAAIASQANPLAIIPSGVIGGLCLVVAIILSCLTCCWGKMKNSLVAEYPLTVSADEFYGRHAPDIEALVSNAYPHRF